MSKFFDKYDFILLFVLILGLIVSVQTFLFEDKMLANNQRIEVSITAPINTVITQEQLENIKELYFSNATDTSEIISVVTTNGSAVFTLVDQGVWSKDASIFNGQHFGLNQRVRLHGQIEAEGVVSKVEIR